MQVAKVKETGLYILCVDQSELNEIMWACAEESTREYQKGRTDNALRVNKLAQTLSDFATK